MTTGKILKSSPAELGYQLPIGALVGSSLSRSFGLGDFNYHVEKSLGDFKKRNQTLPNTAAISKLVALMLTNLGGEKFEHLPTDSIEDETKAVIDIGKLFFADVYYIYVKIRIESLGPEFDVQFMCPTCKYQGKMTVDLNTMDVFTVGDPSVLLTEVELFRGLRFRDGSIKKRVKIQPMLWLHMTGDEAKEAAGDQTLMKLHFISKCVVGVEGFDDSVLLTQEELGSLGKLDIEKISQAINEINFGPSLIVNGECPNRDCTTPFMWPIDWDYDNFFSVSSP
jgi:hypothetical protein